jgi:hypothetical protein
MRRKFYSVTSTKLIKNGKFMLIPENVCSKMMPLKMEFQIYPSKLKMQGAIVMIRQKITQ